MSEVTLFNTGNRILVPSSALNEKGTLKLCRLLDRGGKKLTDSELALRKRIGRR